MFRILLYWEVFTPVLDLKGDLGTFRTFKTGKSSSRESVKVSVAGRDPRT